MREDRIKEIQIKTMVKKSEDELKEIIDRRSKINWEPEAFVAAERELEDRLRPKPIIDESISKSVSSLKYGNEDVHLLVDEVQKLRSEVLSLRNNLAGTNNTLPQTDVVSPSFFRRAFAIWGHYLFAQLVIAIAVFGIIVILSFIITIGSY